MKLIKYYLLLFVLGLSILTSLSAHAEGKYGPNERRFGVGVYAGEPLGLTAKGYMTSRFAITGIAGWSLWDKGITLITDVTYDLFEISSSQSTVKVPLYIGAGGKFVFDNESARGQNSLGVHVPVGIAIQWVNHPYELAFEAAPGLELTPDTEFDLSGGVAFRYYF